MGKRAARRRSGEFNTEHYQEEKVRALFPGTNWTPDEKEPMRDQRYMKKVKPRSEGQARLMESIDGHNLIMALGPVEVCRPEHVDG